MRRAQRLHADTPPAFGLEADPFALDAIVIDLSLALFPRARWQQSKASVKLNVLLGPILTASSQARHVIVTIFDHNTASKNTNQYRLCFTRRSAFVSRHSSPPFSQ